MRAPTRVAAKTIELRVHDWTRKKETVSCDTVSFFSRARDGAQGPGDLGFAPTGAAAETIELRVQDWTRKKSSDTIRYHCFFSRARDGDRTRDPLLGKEVLHR